MGMVNNTELRTLTESYNMKEIRDIVVKIQVTGTCTCTCGTGTCGTGTGRSGDGLIITSFSSFFPIESESLNLCRIPV